MLRVILVILALVAVAAGALYIPYAQDLAEARARLTGRSQTIETPFGTLEYAEEGSGEPLLTIHGSGGGFDQGLAFSEALAGKGFRRIAPSRFGYLGSSNPEGATIEEQADAFAALLDRLGIDKALVFGGSAGVLSAMQFAIRHGERCRALVLLVPAAYAPTRKPGTNAMEGPVGSWVLRTLLGSDFAFWAAGTFFPDFVTRLVLATDPALVRAASAEEQARVATVRAHIQPISLRTDGLLFDMKTAGNPPPMALDAIRCPVLTISLRDDTFGTAAPAEYIAANVPDGRAILYPTGGHVWVGHQDEIWREIEAFLTASAARE